MTTQNLVQFKLNDIVQIGTAGRRGKIVDIVRPLGTYQIYKVQSFDDGTIYSAARHELIKGLPDDLLSLPADLLFEEFDVVPSTCCTLNSLISTTPSINSAMSMTTSEIMSVSTSTSNQTSTNPTDRNYNAGPSCITPMTAVISGPQTPINPVADATFLSTAGSYSPKTIKNRFPETDNSTDEYIRIHENKATVPKTAGHQKLVDNFLNFKKETRQLHCIPPQELDKYLSEFFMKVRQKNGSNYELTTLKGIQGSIQRILNRHRYGYSLTSDPEFAHSRECFETKKTELKKDGKGSKPKTADELNDDEISYLFEKGQLGTSTPEAVLNTLWLNNTMHFGIRGGGTEHRQILWGDIQLGYDHDLKSEYLIFNERQTKTRTGQDISNVRLTKPRLYATQDVSRCPVETYKFYSDRRPENSCQPTDPFYLAPITNAKRPPLSEPWFINQPVGKNKLYNIMKTMTTKAGLQTDKRLTNTSARKHLCQKLLRNGIPDTQAVQITGHKNPQSLNNYRSLTNRQQQHISSLLSCDSTSQGNCHGSRSDARPNLHTVTEQVPTATVPTLPRNPVTIGTNHANIPNYVQNSEMSLNVNTSPASAFRSIFQNSTIHGGTFNITFNMVSENSNPHHVDRQNGRHSNY